MAKMNLAIHGIDNKGLGARWGDTFARDQHADVQMDYVMANPPFNIKDWARNDRGPPLEVRRPAGQQRQLRLDPAHPVEARPGRQAGVVMANGSMSSNSNGEGQIRAQIVEADLVSCMVALPTQLFRSTGIPVCLWFFAKDKRGQAGWSTGRPGALHRRPRARLHGRPRRAGAVRRGHRPDRRHLPRLARLGLGGGEGMTYEDVPGFCRSVDAGRDQGGRLRAHAGAVRRRVRRRGRRRADRGEDRAAEARSCLAAFDESAQARSDRRDSSWSGCGERATRPQQSAT